jgi:hypothetical protein
VASYVPVPALAATVDPQLAITLLLAGYRGPGDSPAESPSGTRNLAAQPMHHAPVAFLLHPSQQLSHPAIAQPELLARLPLRQMSLPDLVQHLQSIPILHAQHQHLLFAHPGSLPVLNRNFLLCWNRNFSFCRDMQNIYLDKV